MSRSKKNIVKRKHKKLRNKSKKNMRGGFAPDETQHLLDNGFQQHQIDELSNLNVTIDIINQAIEYYNNNFNAHQIILDIAKNLHANLPPLTNIGAANNMVPEPDQYPEAQNNQHFDDSFHSENNDNQPFLNANDLQVPEGNEMPEGLEIPQDANDNHEVDMNQSLDLSGDTSVPDESMNSSMNSSMNDSMGSAISNDTNNTTNNSLAGGKRRRSKKRNSNLKRNKSHKRTKGGALFGNGYGANSCDPNYSVYNTNLTKLFPYRPSN